MYAKQVFWEAVGTLIGPGDIQQRLANASGALGGYGLVKLSGSVHNDLPEEHQDEFSAIWQELHKDGTLAETTRKLSSEEASKLAKRIFDIYTDIMGGL
jgi:hypothetical protein